MLRYTFTNGSNSLFQRFSVFRLHVGILMWISIFFESLISCLQPYHLAYNAIRTEGTSASSIDPMPLHIYVSIALRVLAFLLIPLVVKGVIEIRASFCVPYLFTCFISSFESLILFVVGTIDYTNTGCASDLYYGIWFASVLPFHVFSTGVAFWFIVFAQQFSYYVAYEKEIIDADCLFQIHRIRRKVMVATPQPQSHDKTPQASASPIPVPATSN
ncbi:hypothetical protein M3Y97_00429600 [Aphelenchoides bicaudatus]|nr:hypothetical protein M3Y97_00429600 [Aphelenchoides bicaudatus]